MNLRTSLAIGNAHACPPHGLAPASSKVVRSVLAAVVAAVLVALQCGCSGSGGGAREDAITNPVLADVLSPAAMAGAETGPILDPSSLTPTELRFGRSPKADPNVTYQPGVIVMEQGAAAISSMESNGIVWHFKADAPQVDQIQEDAVIFATERCVGRVLRVDRSGDDVRVVLGPVQITDVFQKAHFALDQPIDLTQAIAVAAPDFPNPTPVPETSASPAGAQSPSPQQSESPSPQQSESPSPQQSESPSPQQSESPSLPPSASPSPSSSSATIDMRRARLVSMTYAIVAPSGTWRPFRAVTFGLGGVVHRAVLETVSRRVPMQIAQAVTPGGLAPSVPAPGTEIPTVDIAGGLDATPCLGKCGGLGLQMTYDQGGVKIFAYAVLYLQNPRAKVNLNIDGGVKSVGIHLAGVAGFKAHFELGAESTFVRNVHLTGEVPIDLSFLVNMLTPVSIHFTQSLILNTGFSARTSVLGATFDYSMCCSIGVGYNGTGYGSDGPVRFAAKNDVAHDVKGVSVGINSAVFSVRQQVMLGIGYLGFATGPYVGVIESTTALKQSSIATPIMVPIGADVGCRQATFELSLDGGVGWTINRYVAAVVNFFLGVFHAKPIPSKGSFIQIPSQRLIGERHEMPDKCAGG